MNIDDTRILYMYVSSGGMVPLALERIKRDSGEILEEQELTEIIARNLAKVQDLVKASILMQTFQLTGLAISSAQSKMATMLPGDAGNFATRLIQQVKDLTDKHENTQNINLNNYVWENLLDAEASEAIRYLQNQRSNIIDITPKLLTGTDDDQQVYKVYF